MQTDEIKKAFIDTLVAWGQMPVAVPQTNEYKKTMDFSKFLMIFATVLCTVTWIASVVAWFLWREFPEDITQYSIWFYGTSLVVYMAKSGYENKAKICCGQEEATL